MLNMTKAYELKANFGLRKLPTELHQNSKAGLAMG